MTKKNYNNSTCLLLFNHYCQKIFKHPVKKNPITESPLERYLSTHQQSGKQCGKIQVYFCSFVFLFLTRCNWNPLMLAAESLNHDATGAGEARGVLHSPLLYVRGRSGCITLQKHKDGLNVLLEIHLSQQRSCQWTNSKLGGVSQSSPVVCRKRNPREGVDKGSCFQRRLRG